MDEATVDARLSEILLGLMQVRRQLDPESFVDLLGAVMVEIDVGKEVALESAYRRRPEGNVVPFPPPGTGHTR